MKPEQVWRAALGQLQLEMPKATFDTWVRDTQLLASEDGTYIIGVQNAYARDWLENRLRSTIHRTLIGIVGHTVEVRFVVWQAEAPEAEPAFSEPLTGLPAPQSAAALQPLVDNLSTRYTFESFVVGPSNRLAHAACLAASENPATAYNPLFLYGGVGLGKTHLLHAVGNACRKNGLRVLYVSSEQFTNELINAIRAHNTEDFREKYRRMDVLLVDDIQFIAGKESTQEEFFHTFNTLHGQERQLVISSDRPPKALVTLEERLRSRFEWGLTADIQPPDLETRVAILRSKAERAGRLLPYELLELIARRVQSNIRELEGALTRVLAFADLRGEPLTLELVDVALADMLPRQRSLTPARVIETVARYFGYEVEALLGQDRSRDVALPRQMTMYLIREETDASLPAIGDALGGRDHTTILYGVKRIADLMERDDSVRRQLISIREQLYSQVGYPA